MAGDGAFAAVFLPAGAGDVAAGDAFDGNDVGFFAEHGAAFELGGEGVEGFWEFAEAGGEEVIFKAGEFFEPEEGEGGEDFSLVGDALGHDDVEGADAVGGDDEKGFAEVVDVADFSLSLGER